MELYGWKRIELNEYFRSPEWHRMTREEKELLGYANRDDGEFWWVLFYSILFYSILFYN